MRLICQEKLCKLCHSMSSKAQRIVLIFYVLYKSPLIKSKEFKNSSLKVTYSILSDHKGKFETEKVHVT